MPTQAVGQQSPVRKSLGASEEAGYRGEWHAFRQYFTGVSGPAASQLWVVFEPDILPGYFWSFPLVGGRANVGFGILRSRTQMRGAELARLWPDLLSRDHIRELLGPAARPESPHRAWPIPTRAATLTAAGGRAMFVGDAARAGDPMTGEGIGQALETGVLAARAILRAGAMRPGHAATQYHRAVGSGMGLDNALASQLARALAHRKGARGAVRIAASSPWRATHFARWMFEDFPRALPATPWRWGRNALSQPGAFGGSSPG
ncbi:MAG: hypothetical protein ACRDX8_11505 [Acidimicrobiales bacterium]